MLRPSCLILLVIGLGCSSKSLAESPPLAMNRSAVNFLNEYCIACHGPRRQENDYRFDTLHHQLTDRQTLESWQAIVDQINRGEMPPPESRQPTEAVRENFVDSVTEVLQREYQTRRSADGAQVIRRLNRHELRNTLRDLLYLEGSAYQSGAESKLVDNNGNGRVERTGSDPVRAFPEDEKEGGFANIGSRLVMSDFLLQLTLGAADETLAAATHTEPRPDTAIRRFSGHIFTEAKYGQQTLETVSRSMNPDYDLITQRYQQNGRLAPTQLRGGVGASGRYRVTIQAAGFHQQHPWSELIPTDPNSEFELGLHLADTANGGLAGPTSHVVRRWTLPGDGKKRTFEFETWIDRSWTPWIGWENGPYSRQLQPHDLVSRYLPEAYYPRPDRKLVDKDTFDRWPIEMATQLLQSGYEGPHLRIYSLSLEPLIPTWPPISHQSLYGEKSSPTKLQRNQVDQLLLRFAQRAFRRQVSPDQIRRYTDLVWRLYNQQGERAAPLHQLRFKVYEGKWSKLPDFDALTPVQAGEIPSGLIDLRAADRKEHFGVVFDAILKVSESGTYRMEVASDDGSCLLIDDQQVVLHDGLHGASTKTAEAHLTAGQHRLKLNYFAYGQPNSLYVACHTPNGQKIELSVPKGPKPKTSIASREQMRQINTLRAGYMAMLCSPEFLYIREPQGRLDDFAIATRLSYFLWSSMPDETLFALARRGRLSDPSEIRQQVGRMLEDSRSDAFAHNFTRAWLRLDRLGKMPPEKSGPFRFYHDRKMEPMLVSETTQFFNHLLQNNRPVTELIDADYTFMNETMANWIYQRDDVPGEGFRRVSLEDPRRGGILTHSSVLTATANGVDTSPIVRGVWLLENVLGTPPSPPPPDVEPLSPDLRGAKTIREQLELHRQHAACKSCHSKIDPMGFAMENFDPVGRWRDRYPKTNQPIDSATTSRDGTQIADIVGMKQYLRSRQDDIIRCLTEKLLIYATGRSLQPRDGKTVSEISRNLIQSGGGLKDLVVAVTLSDAFLAK